MINFFRVTGWLEGTSLLTLFFVAMPMKYIAHDAMLVKVVGSMHGALFLFYVFTATLIARNYSWPKKKLLSAYLCSVLPFGTFYFEAKKL